MAAGGAGAAEGRPLVFFLINFRIDLSDTPFLDLLDKDKTNHYRIITTFNKEIIGNH